MINIEAIIVVKITDFVCTLFFFSQKVINFVTKPRSNFDNEKVILVKIFEKTF